MTSSSQAATRRQVGARGDCLARRQHLVLYSYCAWAAACHGACPNRCPPSLAKVFNIRVCSSLIYPSAGSEDERPAKPAAKPAAAKKQKAKPAKPAESESEAASSEEEEEEVAAAAGEDSDASAGVADFKSPAGARSPDENLASRGNGGSSGKGKAAAVRAKSSNKAARPAASLEDSDGEQPAVPAKRRAMADWSDDE
jgi:hypothetical protein